MKKYHKNPRYIKEGPFTDLRRWLVELGDLSGIVHNLNTDETVTGNQRCRAIDVNECEIVLDYQDEKPDSQGTVGLGYVVWRGHRYNYRQVRWDTKTAEKANIVANKAGGEWDFDILANQFEMPDLLDWGFDESELQLDWGGDDEVEDPGAQVDRAEELQELWQVKSGDIWRLGENFVICGDCRELDTWSRLLKAAGIEKVNGVFTSPPYAEQRKKQYGGTPTDQYVEWWDAVQSNVRSNLADDGSFFVNIKPHCEKGQRVLYVFDLVLAMVRRWGWRFVDELCWIHSGSPGKVFEHLKNQFEPIYQFSIGKVKIRPKNAGHWSESIPQGGGPNMSSLQGDGPDPLRGIKTLAGVAYPGNVISAGKNLHKTGHQAAFPIKLPDFFIRAYSDEQDAWCDPFLGSGTTIMAAQKNKRVAVGIERLEKYVAVTIQRWTDMCGGVPVLLE